MPSDRNGRPVVVGTRVRVLVVARFLKRAVPTEEWRDLETMVGEVFEVYEVDESGSCWVQKVWDDGDGQSHSHSLALESSEMEVVEGGDR
jgi:hypothetical protein